MICNYCTEDFEGYVKGLDKNAHVFLYITKREQSLHIDWYNHKMNIPINYCPICGRKLN